MKRTKSKSNIIRFPGKAATIDDTELIGRLVDALCDVAGAVVHRSRDPEGWAFTVLALATERSRHIARQTMSPEGFEALTAEVEAMVTAIREASEVVPEELGVR